MAEILMALGLLSYEAIVMPMGLSQPSWTSVGSYRSASISRCGSVAVGYLLLAGHCGLSLWLGLIVGNHNIHFPAERECGTIIRN